VARDDRDWKANVTVLDGSRSGSVVGIDYAGGPTNAVDGFTIRNGSGAGDCGGGISCYGSSPLICNNTIVNNTGKGMACFGSVPVVRHNVIMANSGGGVSDGGGGAYFYGCILSLLSNTIVANSATGYGGGVYLNNYDGGTWAKASSRAILS
jgi:hypothetical protein